MRILVRSRGLGEMYKRQVPEDLEKSSFTGEWIGMVTAAAHSANDVYGNPADGDTSIVTDSAALLNGWNKVSSREVSHNL